MGSRDPTGLTNVLLEGRTLRCLRVGKKDVGVLLVVCCKAPEVSEVRWVMLSFAVVTRRLFASREAPSPSRLDTVGICFESPPRLTAQG
jgi:hypothetical protein